VSDGLIADSGHIALASRAAIEIDLDRVPLSPAGAAYAAEGTDRTQRLVGLCAGGDDYEIVLTVAAVDASGLVERAASLGIALTVVGRVAEGEGVRVLLDGREIRVAKTGYRHRR
jgi:thiamine-monophosphate kinase